MGLNTCSRPTATRPASISYISALISISSTYRWKLARTTKSFKSWVGAAVWEKGREHRWSVASRSDRCEYLASKEMKWKVNLFLDGLQLPNCVSRASFSDKTRKKLISLVHKLLNSVAFKNLTSLVFVDILISAVRYIGHILHVIIVDLVDGLSAFCSIPSPTCWCELPCCSRNAWGLPDHYLQWLIWFFPKRKRELCRLLWR